MDPSLVASLRQAAICGSLADAELEAIATIAERVTYVAGEELFREGDAGDGLYLVLSGEIDVVKRAAGGERSLARLGAGGVLGEMSLLTDDVRSATGRALVDSTVLRLPAIPFRALLAGGAPAALKLVAGIAEVLARRVATMNATVIELAARAEQGRDETEKARAEKLVELHRTLQVWSY